LKKNDKEKQIKEKEELLKQKDIQINDEKEKTIIKIQEKEKQIQMRIENEKKLHQEILLGKEKNKKYKSIGCKTNKRSNC